MQHGNIIPIHTSDVVVLYWPISFPEIRKTCRYVIVGHCYSVEWRHMGHFQLPTTWLFCFKASGLQQRKHPNPCGTRFQVMTPPCVLENILFEPIHAEYGTYSTLSRIQTCHQSQIVYTIWKYVVKTNANGFGNKHLDNDDTLNTAMHDNDTSGEQIIIKQYLLPLRSGYCFVLDNCGWAEGPGWSTW